MPNKVLFISHGNNDLDHFLPLIHKMLKDNIFIPHVLYVKCKEDVLTNNIHKHILKDLKIKEYDLFNFINNNLITNLFLKIYKFCLTKSGHKISNRRGLSFFRPDYFFMKSYILLFNLIIDKLDSILLNKNIINEFLRKKSFSTIIVDQVDVPQLKNYKDILIYTLFLFRTEAKFLSIPTYMMSHGTLTTWNNLVKSNSNKAILYPDLLALCNLKEKKIFDYQIGLKTSLKISGDTRYDTSWIKELEKISELINPIKKTNNRYIVLIIDRSFHNATDRKLARGSVHTDVRKLIDDFPEIELWYKAHPRYPGATKIIPHERIKVFYNNIDSNFLLQLADSVLSFTSGLLFQPIINQKKVIYCDNWIKYCLKGTKTVFENTECVFKVSNYQELKNAIKDSMNNILIPISEVNKFYKENVSGGISINKSIIDNHISNIKFIIKK